MKNQKQKINSTDVIVVVSCILIIIFYAFKWYSDNYIVKCHYCNKIIDLRVDDYVARDGFVYFHIDCYRESVKEEKK